MTLDEAIKHCLEVAEEQEKDAEYHREWHENYYEKDCRECAADHRQLAEWLTELKQWRRVYGVCPSYEMCIPECKEGYNAQIAEYKRLLKAALEDIRYLINHAKWNGKACDRCKYGNEMYCYADDCSNDAKWQHEAEALALLGKDIDVTASADDTNVGRKSGGWISCEDRLPGENTLVLCYARSTTGEGNQYFIGAIAHGEFWFLKVYDIGRVSHPVHYWEVTHWQPLPEPPKDGAENG